LIAVLHDPCLMPGHSGLHGPAIESIEQLHRRIRLLREQLSQQEPLQQARARLSRQFRERLQLLMALPAAQTVGSQAPPSGRRSREQLRQDPAARALHQVREQVRAARRIQEQLSQRLEQQRRRLANAMPARARSTSRSRSRGREEEPLRSETFPSILPGPPPPSPTSPDPLHSDLEGSGSDRFPPDQTQNPLYRSRWRRQRSTSRASSPAPSGASSPGSRRVRSRSRHRHRRSSPRPFTPLSPLAQQWLGRFFRQAGSGESWDDDWEPPALDSSATVASSGTARVELVLGSEEQLRGAWVYDTDSFNAFLCPITHDIMRDPVVSADGHTYERSAIEHWLQRSRKSPMTGQILRYSALYPNQALRNLLTMLSTFASDRSTDSRRQ